MSGFTKVLGVCALVILGTLFGGFTFQTMWAWFVVPTLGFGPLSIPYAIGLSLFIKFATFHYNGNKDENSFESTIIAGMLVNVVALVIGAVIHAFC